MQALTQIDTLWLLFCSSLLLLMQTGFVCLESGLIRSKNNINVVMKNLLDLCVAFLGYGFVGFSIMFLIGADSIFAIHPLVSEQPVFVFVVFVFQAMFCATTATIVSGAVAERMSFGGYAFITVIVATCIYPIVGSWVWGGVLGHPSSLNWLANIGFYDFAGSTVVHSVGGWVALAAILFIGPRLGRYDNDGQDIHPSSITFACLGSLLIWIGWIGFNGGSLLRFDDTVSKVITNTIMAGVSGLSAGLIYSYVKYGKPLVLPMVNGGLVGLISVTGSADLMLPYQAILFGLVGGLIPMPVYDWLNKHKIDDAIGAVPVHLAGGIYATLATAFVLTKTNDKSLIENLLVQGLGVIVVGIFVFGATYLLLWLCSHFIHFRVNPEHELIGLNQSEHDLVGANADMLTQLTNMIKQGGSTQKISVDKYSDSYQVAQQYNKIVDMFARQARKNEHDLEKALHFASHDDLSGLHNRFAFNQALNKESENLQRYGGTYCIAILDIDFFKKINDTYGHDVGDEAIQHVAQLLKKNVRTTDTLARIGGEEFAIIFPHIDLVVAFELLNKLKNIVQNTPLKASNNTNIPITLSGGITLMQQNEDPNQALKRADNGLYQAKNNGRNRIEICEESEESIA